MKKNLVIIILIFILIQSTVNAAFRWNDTCDLEVYIPRSEYSSLMKRAFEYWSRATTHRVGFSFVSDERDANIIIIFKDHLDGNAVGLTDISSIKRRQTGDDIIKSAKIYIARYNSQGQGLNDDTVYTTMLHEIGHALGLQHTNDKESIMYPYANEYKTMEVTNQDLKDLKRNYEW